MDTIRVFLADDHDLFREGLAGIIASQADMEVVGEASDGLEAIVKALELTPDLILMDIQMPGCDGLEATKKIKKDLPETTIVVLTVRDEDEKLFEAIKNGAQGYLLKTIRSREMLEMLRGAMQGEAAISPNLAGRMLEEFRRLSKLAPIDLDEEIVSLTQREQEVLSLVATGATDKEIAEKLYISLHTVKSHMRNILAKLQVNSRREAARLAKQKGLL
ncbi:MAG: response regulator transcription factor [Anaerolineales bacterium]|jgi:DNA-binding NarL/FixJ family response regulator